MSPPTRPHSSACGADQLYSVGPFTSRFATAFLAPVSPSRVTVVVPAKDEEGLIGEIVDSVKPFADEVLVIDGHSRDRTAAIAVEHGARVVQDSGRGKGEALRLSFTEASGDIV